MESDYNYGFDFTIFISLRRTFHRKNNKLLHRDGLFAMRDARERAGDFSRIYSRSDKPITLITLKIKFFNLRDKAVLFHKVLNKRSIVRL